MKFSSIFFGVVFLFAVSFGISGNALAQTFNCTSGNESGSCVAGSNECVGGTTHTGTECAGNTEKTLCCVTSSTGSGSGTACTSPGGQSGGCYATGQCPGSLPYGTQSSTCSNLGLAYCCVARSDASGNSASCSDTASHCKSNCTNYGGIKAGCDSACPAGTGSYYYCVQTVAGSTTTTGGSTTTSSSTSSSSGGWTAGFERVQTDSGLSKSSISTIVSNLMIWMLLLFGFLSVIGFVIAGLLYLTAAGDEKQIGTAKAAMKWSIVGVVVALMGYVIIYAADTWLSGGTDF